MLKVKLSRTGKRNQAHYRIVVNEAKSKRDGKYVDKLGYYNPLTDPATVEIDIDRYKDWLSKGAQPTDTVRTLVEAKINPKKKVKKASKKAKAATKEVAAVKEEAPAESKPEAKEEAKTESKAEESKK